MTIYFGFAIADGMFPPKVAASRQPLTTAEAVALISAGGVVPALNPYHRATIAAMRNRFGIEVEIPESPPKINLKAGDKFIVMSVRGLPRLTEAREYTDEEIASATFAFGLWMIHAELDRLQGLKDLNSWGQLPLALNVRQAAALLNVTERTITRLCVAGQLPAARVGRAWRLDRDELREFLQKNRRKNDA